MKKSLEKSLRSGVELLREFGIEPHEWILVGPHADLLNEYAIRYDRPTHFHVLVERKKIPWTISKEQKDVIEVTPPISSQFQKRYEQYMDETGHDFDLILAPKPLTGYADEIELQPISGGGFFQRMKPLGNIVISKYIFSQFSPDKLRRQDVISYIEIIVSEAKKRGDPALIASTEEFVESVLKRQEKGGAKEDDLIKEFTERGLIKGVGAFKGKIKGKVQIIKNVEIAPKSKLQGVVVMSRVSPKVLPAIAHAKAWIVNEGGTLSHGAIVARELKKPCIIGTKIATKVLKDGDMVEVDAEKGVVRIIK